MIFKQIKEKLHASNHTELSKTLGYNNQKNFEKTLEKFLSFANLHGWFESGNYDFVNQPCEFFTKLSIALDLEKQNIKETLEEEQVYVNEAERFKGSYIFVNTNFRRKNEPIFVLAFLEHKRYINLSGKEELYFKSTDEILEIQSQEIKEHYEAHKEGLYIWGKIISYQVHFEDKIYIFDTYGILQQNTSPIFESKATLSLK